MADSGLGGGGAFGCVRYLLPLRILFCNNIDITFFRDCDRLSEIETRASERDDLRPETMIVSRISGTKRRWVPQHK